jgi:TP901 family phage tail tape measure protein
MGRLGDVMAYTFTTSNTDMEMLGETMKYVAPIASKAGASLEQVAAMSGMLGDVGIQGSMAGTALRAAFIRLADPPKEAANALHELGVSAKDSIGNMRSTTDVMLDLQKASSKLSSGKKLEYISSIFGAEAASGMMELVSNADKLDRKFRDIEKSSAGVADKVAKTMGDNYAGRVKEMQSALEGLHITIGDLILPVLKAKVERMTGWINLAQQWIEKNKAITRTLVELATKAATAISVFGGIAIATASVITPLAYLRFGLFRFVGGLGLFRGGFMLASGALIVGLSRWQQLLPTVTRFFPVLGAWLVKKSHRPASD